MLFLYDASRRLVPLPAATGSRPRSSPTPTATSRMCRSPRTRWRATRWSSATTSRRRYPTATPNSTACQAELHAGDGGGAVVRRHLRRPSRADFDLSDRSAGAAGPRPPRRARLLVHQGRAIASATASSPSGSSSRESPRAGDPAPLRGLARARVGGRSRSERERCEREVRLAIGAARGAVTPAGPDRSPRTTLRRARPARPQSIRCPEVPWETGSRWARDRARSRSSRRGARNARTCQPEVVVVAVDLTEDALVVEVRNDGRRPRAGPGPGLRLAAFESIGAACSSTGRSPAGGTSGWSSRPEGGRERAGMPEGGVSVSSSTTTTSSIGDSGCCSTGRAGSTAAMRHPTRRGDCGGAPLPARHRARRPLPRRRVRSGALP